MVDSKPAYVDLVYQNDSMIFTDSCYLDDNNDIKYRKTDYISLASPKTIDIDNYDSSEQIEDNIEGFDIDLHNECPYKKVNRINLRNNQWNMRKINNKNWSPTETLKKYSNDNKMESEIFDNFTKSFVNDKCWNKKDFDEFIFISNELNKMYNSKNTNDEKIQLLLNPNFHSYYHIILDKLDTLNVMCMLNNKCDNIDNILSKEQIKNQAKLMIELIDVYAPIYYRTVDLLETKLNETNCNIDPVYYELMDKIKSHLISSHYSIEKSKGNLIQRNNMTNNNIPKSNILKSNVSKEKYNILDDNNFIILLVIILIVIIYFLI
jgi:hypothetical protein